MLFNILKSAYLASNAKAMIPDATGQAAEVPVKLVRHWLSLLDVIWKRGIDNLQDWTNK